MGSSPHRLIESHAAELRENLVPLSAELHIAMDASPCLLCIFPHEDTVARTLSYELDVKEYRLTEIRQGRGDPGRPPYEQGYPVVQTTISTGPILQHRLFLRFPNDDDDIPRRVRDATTQRHVTKLYLSVQCPGMPSPPPRKERFPIIDTLLSIPFSLLHNSPRLVSQVPYTSYQATLLSMATKVIELWSWDPSPEELQQGGMINTNTQRAPWPASVFDQSRNGVTFESYRSYFEPALPPAPPPAALTSTQTPSNHESVHSLTAGQVVIGGVVGVTYDKEEGLGTTATSIDAEASKEVASLSSWPRPVSEQSCSSHTSEHSSLPKDPIRRTVDEIESWRKGTELAEPENIEIARSPFERGCIGDCSVNDRLMVMGLIDPQIWVRFWDLSVF